ncbi:2'-5' RNA ligase family protein [Variovorax sp. PAMC26660]|uniref:2'-5' RNA ligase family protein n=1 Tax=Variovorax sp. PAMC26660 TaxID=2762322 RepID=UPI00164D4137|nr:2'-5' RNA ligase family protein [Variovorax sp. PAMC26660]QNK67576.1 2'-5' RNA ligase family protein [Variovorax sp. PAMC26660]
MSEQFLLPGIDPPPRPLPRSRKNKPQRKEALPHALFFAILPSPQDAASIAALGALMDSRHVLKATLIDAPRLHVTLHDLGEYAVVPQDKVALARAAAATLEAPSFDVVFDRSMSYAKGALVLCGNEGTGALAQFRQRLGEALADAGFKPTRAFTPHMTLAYARRKLEEHAIDEPVRWRAGSLALIDSHVGEGVHEILAQWPVMQNSEEA